MGVESGCQIAKRMADAIAYRGPDDSGVWASPDGRTVLSHRRLSILDVSSSGHQPMTSQSGNSTIVFNGEIYNFQEIRDRLEASGTRFRSGSDTEVLLELLEQRGEDGIGELDGMFAFAWHDKRSGRTLLARDNFGEKPLYYTDTKHYFAFASELHALTLLPDFDARIDSHSIAQYLTYQYVPGADTIYASARKLPPGSILSIDATGERHIERRYRFEVQPAEGRTRSIADAADELEDILKRSVRQRLVSDVPLGAFLSGGVDSSVVVALAMRMVDRPLKTFTIGFEGADDSEHFDAAAMAEMLGTEHYEKILAPDGIALCERIGTVLDEPNGDSSCLPTSLLSEYTREHVTVALSGDGGDELFGGYGRYFATIDEQQKKRAHGGMEWWTPGTAYWSSRILVYPESEVEMLAGSVPTQLAETLRGMRADFDGDGRPLIHYMREADAANYMPGAVLAKVDRMSMQSSLEVRAPLIGREVAAFAERLNADECVSDGAGKLVLKEVAGRYIPREWLDRPKRGFGLPMGIWSAAALLPAARELLLSEDTRLHGWIGPDRIAAYLNRMEADFSAYRVWSLLVLEYWLRAHPYRVGEQFETLAAPARKPARVVSAFRTIARNGRRLFSTPDRP
ncbi:MAG: asparagine synthase (glutamine-hydrolyzing) [Roseitalea sp.]|nr:asparagine synthase (glutamine-hydrolyzing) [Roseitalea sp.]MBO6670482.1 asparagine synthase (glutamine-hydrolyzing) [Roseitalea sp.]MBO6950914.1 asparagine synthase (glutamine-hydrolyzing) [Rhizobiaceae bacterium]